MPFDVGGFIEVDGRPPRDREGVWFGAVVLDAFGPRGDDVSQLLFGLSKRPRDEALFARRGIPADSSAMVRRAFEDDQRFVKVHGEGAFGHTYASVSEIRGVDWQAYGVDPKRSAWWGVFEITEAIRRQQRLSEAQVRFVVWANW